MNYLDGNNPLEKLRNVFGEQLQENVRMSNYTTARVGGCVDGLLIIHSASELEHAAGLLWEYNVPFRVIGSGANILVSENGYQGVILVNRAHNIKIETHSEPFSVLAETGAILSGIANQAALRGLSGLEWAATVPGTVGGAIYGNAGAFGSDTGKSLILAEIMQPGKVKEVWACDRFEYGYRTSLLKRGSVQAVILSARFKLEQGKQTEIQERMQEFISKRHSSQPTGASMGSTFKNPPGDFAGRLIEAAGLKGKIVGDAEINTTHANFIINHGKATAEDYYHLIRLVQKTVMDKFNVGLELEIEFLGDWKE